MDDQWMTPKQAAEYLQVSLPTIYRWADSGLLRKHKLGRFVRFRMSELDAAVRANNGNELN